MGEHEHDHPATSQGVPVDAEETKRLRAEAHAHIGTALGYFLAMAADSGIRYERAFWLRKVDGERYMIARRAARERLDQRARENMQADTRLAGTEARLEAVRTVGNAVVLQLVKGPLDVPVTHSLVSRKAGETGTTGHGGTTYPDHWVIQGLPMNAVLEFAVVSEDWKSDRQVTGPWLAVPIGDVSTESIQDAERARADEEYRAREQAERDREREHSEAVAERRQDRREALDRQREEARIDRERRERERIAREEAHALAVRELPLVKPREIGVRLQGLPDGRILAHLEWLRGKKRPLFYRVEVNGTVLGDDPGGQWSGAKPADHRYTRTVEVPKGQEVEIGIAGVTNHGDGEYKFKIPVPASLCETDEDAAPTRMDAIVHAVKTYTGRRTRSGKPYVRALRRHARMRDITVAERNKAHALATC